VVQQQVTYTQPAPAPIQVAAAAPVAVSAPAEIGTNYAANGGYLY